jgi:hypothetical protein
MAKNKNNAKKPVSKKQAKREAYAAATRDPYYPTDYTKYRKKKDAEVKPMKVDDGAVSTKTWWGTLIVSLIPIINIIALIAWSGKKNAKVNPSKRNFCRVALPIILIIYVVIAAAAYAIMSGLISF